MAQLGDEYETQLRYIQNEDNEYVEKDDEQEGDELKYDDLNDDLNDDLGFYDTIFYNKQIAIYTKDQFIYNCIDFYEPKKLLNTLIIHNDVNRFTYAMDNYLITQSDTFINDTIDILLHMIVKKNMHNIFFKIIIQNYASESHINNIIDKVVVMQNLYYINIIRKSIKNQQTWIYLIRAYISRETYSHKSSNNIVTSLIADIANITNVNEIGFYNASLAVVKYIESRISINQENWNRLVIQSPYLDVKHYAITKLQQPLILNHRYLDAVTTIFLLDCINSSYYINDIYDNRIMIIREYIQCVPRLRGANLARKNNKYILTYYVNKFMYNINHYDINITNIIWEYIDIIHLYDLFTIDV